MNTPRTDNHTFRLLGRELAMPSLIEEARRMELELAELKTPPPIQNRKVGRPRIPKHMVEKILALPKDVTSSAAARKMGLGITTVTRYRRGYR
jgi:hypothetical protein